MRMLLLLTYSKCSKLPCLQVYAVSISSLLSLLHTGCHESLENIIISGTGMVGRVGGYVPQKERKHKAKSYSANSFPYHLNCLHLSSWNKHPDWHIVNQTHKAGICSWISITVSQSAFMCSCCWGIHRIVVCEGPRVQESQVSLSAATTAICCLKSI